MKLYIWKRKDSAVNINNFYPLSRAIIFSGNSFVPIACHAFFRKKDAEQFLEDINWDEETRNNFELLAVEIK